MSNGTLLKEELIVRIPFSKYSGCGNDFIIIDNRSSFFPKNFSYIQKLCKRSDGIGADGLILLEQSDNAPYKMVIFNADGSEAEMCGNGLRCLGRFIQEIDGVSSFVIETACGPLQVEAKEELSTVELPEIKNIYWDLSLPSLPVMHCLNTGVPHAVIFVEDLNTVEVERQGKEIRYHPFFRPQGTNVDYAAVQTRGIRIRTYERGVEAETDACGTGAAAAALAASFQFQLTSPIQIIPRSNEPITIEFCKSATGFKNIFIRGQARKVFAGFIETREKDLQMLIM